MTSQRILVVDDDRNIVRLIRSYFEQAGYQVLTAHNGETALHTIRRDRPDLLILDLMLPDRDGWEITRIVRTDESLNGLPIIMVTARIEDTDKIIGLELGADDYMTKPFNPRELMARARAVLRRSGNGQAIPQMLQVDTLQLDLDRHVVTKEGEPIELTPTEFDLLKVLMQSPGHAFTRLELIENGMGYAYAGMERTVDSHVKNLRKKLASSQDDPTYIQTVYGIGYRLRGNT